MKKLLFSAAITMIVVSPALGGMGDYLSSGSCKGCPSWRSPASSNLPPVMGKTSAAYPYGPLEFKDPYGGPLQGERADTLPPKTKRDIHRNTATRSTKPTKATPNNNCYDYGGRGLIV